MSGKSRKSGTETHLEPVHRRDLDTPARVCRLSRDAQTLIEPDNLACADASILGHVAAMQAAVAQVVRVSSPRFIEERLFCVVHRRFGRLG